MSEIILNPLPFAFDAFADNLSAESFEYHHGKHHKAYVDNLNALLLDNAEYAFQEACGQKNCNDVGENALKSEFLNNIIKKSYEGMYPSNGRVDVEIKLCEKINAGPLLCPLSVDEKIFNNAAQHWNHTFFWNSISPVKNDISPQIIKLIEDAFDSMEKFVQAFKAAGAALFGSGWVWLAFNKATQKVEILQTSNAFTPAVTSEYVPLLVCDVWEHAYYIDYRNKRVDFLQVVADHFNWEFAQKNLENM